MINLIWAMTKTGVIGNKGQLPWKIKSEMQYFQTLTTNKIVLMGAKTFISIKKPLPNRTNIIISNHCEKYQQFHNNNACIVTNDLQAILQKYAQNQKEDLWVIGGAKIYQQVWDYADYLYVSIINEDYTGDSYFPFLDFNAFKLIKTTINHEFTAYVYQRKE